MIRQRLSITGIVQGVGFRPFVWRRATRLGLAGSVENTPAGVVVEVQGPAAAVAAFTAGLVAAAPPLAAVEAIAVAELPLAVAEPAGFRILASVSSAGGRAAIPADIATCPACLAELADPADRRHGHAFISCTDCGPRYTIIERLPYDRGTTTMRGFAMCRQCAAEYRNPADRRFHAQPIACPACGPVAWFGESGPGRAAPAPCRPPAPDSPAAIAAARRLLARGGILAVKNLGGFHLACDATDAAAVARLRDRKHRPAKPLAVLATDLDAARRIALFGEQEARLLAGPERPIVIVGKQPGSGLAEAVAPASDFLGIMLPAAPLQYLLAAGLPPLVMTSGNRAEEPIAFDNADAIARLSGIADGFLLHDRPIETACDDSVVRCVAGAPLPIRRGRGHAPRSVWLAAAGPPVLAVGGELKAALCLAVADRAVMGQHVGDSGSLETLAALERAADHLLRLVAAEPAAIAADLHPGYASAEFAARLAAARGIPLVRVPHHEAHVAALLAEHFGAGAVPTDRGPLLVACFDGTGYRADGTIAGGEFFLADAAGIHHAARLAPFPLPGGDAAIRAPWRAALAALHAAGIPWDARLPPVEAAGERAGRVLGQQLRHGLACPVTTSMGRLFDAVAALAGGPQTITFEAEAALALESWAARGPAADDGRYAFAVMPSESGGLLEIDWRPVVRGVVHDVLAGDVRERIAAGFHHAVVRMLTAVRGRLLPAAGGSMGLTGGVFQNAWLVERAAGRLEAEGVELVLHNAVPPNDGGLALGQAVLARAALGGTGGQPVRLA
jgi:hydrogenase maturation protein HypF